MSPQFPQFSREAGRPPNFPEGRPTCGVLGEGHQKRIYSINRLFISNKAWPLKNFFREVSCCLNVMF